MLRHLWNKDPKGILELKNLKSVEVDNCSSLKYLFTETETTWLVQLREVELKNCHMMEGIIKKDEVEASHTILPSLKSIELECLPNFSSFYLEGGNLLECPALKKISIYDCPKIITTKQVGPKTDDEWQQKLHVNRIPLFNHRVSL